MIREICVLAAAAGTLLAAASSCSGPNDSMQPPPDVTVSTPFTAQSVWEYVRDVNPFTCDDINKTQRVDATGIETRHIAVEVGGIWDVTGQCIGLQEGHRRLFREAHLAVRDKDGAITILSAGGNPQFSFIADCDEQPGRCIEESQ